MRLTFILRTSYLPIKLHVQIFLRERKVGITVFVLQTATPNYRQQVTVLKSFVGTNWKYSITPDMGIALRHKGAPKVVGRDRQSTRNVVNWAGNRSRALAGRNEARPGHLL
ncbi:hypothetical protein Mp_7g08680 [Marchantia polymorpha subsp. ruderalis]|uniref:Uncharacterized protein n=2 Tax=Marchantia polymorpha TaxID=3197 RepID=A0AAF6BXI1_MARPO|nr:hypothetical protein MARPO_0068s0022 [Marchantia polymorpha]BBN16715.1 hypothetical protein Mp_7g08680 [Marchantia polymorpha subsp. ruderalis]|eukprot:PTQ35798.1 hypothetical protein MARPO_0068s0022 [Marchantia polymorpha]